jgi:hypothetical protein
MRTRKHAHGKTAESLDSETLRYLLLEGVTFFPRETATRVAMPKKKVRQVARTARHSEWRVRGSSLGFDPPPPAKAADHKGAGPRYQLTNLPPQLRVDLLAAAA